MPEFTVPGIPVAASAIGDVTATYQALVLLGAGNRQINISLPGVKAGDVLSARPLAAIPDGYDIGAAFCTIDGTLTVIIAHPALAVNAQFSVPLRIFRIMS